MVTMTALMKVIYFAVLEPKSQNEIPHEAVYFQFGTVPLSLCLVHSVKLRERLDLDGLHHVWSEGLCPRTLMGMVEWMERMEDSQRQLAWGEGGRQ